MNVDYLTLACLRDDLDGLLGARVQRVLPVDEMTLGLELYTGQRVQLLLCADPRTPRMLVVPHKLRRGVEAPSPLLLLLRKWVDGSRLVDVTQPAWERILELHFDGHEGRCRLVAELIGRYSNLILVDADGVVLDAAKRIGPDLNSQRVTLPGKPYEPPPKPLGRKPAPELSSNGWTRLLTAADPEQPLHRLLPRRLFAVSPMAAREIAARASGSADVSVGAVDPQAVASATQELFSLVDSGEWTPHIALDETEQIVAFAPYEPRQFERVEATPTINDAMWRYFQEQRERDPYAAVRGRVQQRIEAARGRLQRSLEQVQANRVSPEKVAELREMGELLLTYQGRVERGAREITVPGYDGSPRSIKLDPKQSAVENAQATFRRYRKAERAAQQIPRRIRFLKADLAYLDQLANDLELAASRPEIDAVHEALVEAGWARPPRQTSAGQITGPRRFDIGGFPVYVGRNARQNEEVTFERAGPHDLWLHARGRPGAHVIVRAGHRDVPDHVMRQAAQLAAFYSSARAEGEVPVDATERRFVRRLKSDRPGLVTYRNEQTFQVTASAPEENESR
jgi:predicted ribosome quality control (RQC) complex YloA/Tae2 family protein